MNKSISLENCNSIEQVVELINKDSLADFSKEDLAAQYAYYGAIEALRDENREPSIEDIEAQLDCIVEEAEFNYTEATRLAIEMVNGIEA